jgi:cysteinyl-tRNA synthetase
MDDDFNTANALAVLFEMVRAINSARSAGVGGPFFETAQRTFRELAGVLGLTLYVEESSNGVQMAAKPFIDLLVQIRTDLRSQKQWALADKIRNDLAELSISLEDTAEGTQWRYEEPSL